MKKLILWVFLSLFSVLVHAEIQVQVDPSQVTIGEAFKLTLIQADPQNGGVPDLTVLQKDFVILGTERNVNYSIINGQAQSSSQWVVALRAKKSGILTIPAIKIGLEQSTPITINVEAGSKTQDLQLSSEQSQDVFLTTEVDEKNPYVNQQIIYTVKLYYSKQLLNADYQGPQVEDALLIPLGEEKRYQKVQNNTNYMVEEQRYAIFPQKSGSLKIKSPIFTALIYDIDPQRIQARDKPIKLTVQSIPNQFKGKIWLPARQVRLSEHYENSSQNISQGSTLTRTVTLEGVAIPAQLLPSLDFKETDAFSVYPEKGADHNQVKEGQLVGSTEIKVTYLFNKAGKITIPELRLPWFNTETGKEETAILAPRSLEITPSSSAAVNNASSSPTANKVGATKQPSSDSLSPIQASNNWAWVVAALFALAWLLTLGLWGWQRRSRNLGKGQYKSALDELDKACSQGNPQSARDALLKWAALHWPDAPLLNLTDLTKLVRDAHLKKQLHVLSQVLYGSEDKTLWRGDELLRAVHSVKRAQTRSKRKPQVLPPINPF
ncbi:BatD family protein [Legionella maioricensis]|uniref:BatD family protein n=1 Tax=Legionella maioricensis TaxID=2896528 RepID=A0A9X2CY79_9GAMM|nr:BatD family protein [Legionella maioricensis]MCL9682946.1 BatD family protein [Legionella maioricensis]MCL9686294.1 BatD family protein [Legionella maioricensis]